LPRRVLLADDSVTAQNMGRRILADAGYDVITVNNGSAALKKIAEQQPDLIVLDVYMPGYGGLEVCQRLKENLETAHIPVLLSVGKLEPFKAEEARRVQADAFIVKPFEASELLTALTKLEDKIKPPAAAQKHGRHGKTLEQAGERFGDKETGWKYRLIIPTLADSALQQAGDLQQPKPEVLPQPDPKAVEAKPETPLPDGVPKDITPEEIAALAAAAAAFSGRQEEATIEAAPAIEAQTEPTTAPAETAPEQDPSEAPAAVAADQQASAEQGDQISAPAVPAEASVEAPQTSEIAAETEVETTGETFGGVEADVGKWGKDAEVMAAIASLLPAGEPAQANGASAPSGKSEEIPTTIAGFASATTAGSGECIGPRWMAESVPLMEEETTLLLEQEMEKAYAAFAAAEAARMSVESMPAAALPVPLEAVAANVPSCAEVQPVELAVPAVLANSTEAVVGTEIREVALAAAASMNSADAPAPEASSAAMPAPAVSTPSPDTAATEERDRQSKAELAAAWENWKQIRESIIGSELTSQIAGVAAAELKSSEQRTAAVDEESEEADEESSETEMEASDAEEPSAIASIVDSVLAELKPKLVAEIARKMKQQEKKKQKKGKK
jgi:twitching motility two-component system response regulator PilH